MTLPDNKERFWAHQELALKPCISWEKPRISRRRTNYNFTDGHAKTTFQIRMYYIFFCSNLENPASWSAEGRIDEWIKLYHEASERLKKPDVSFHDRLRISANRCRRYFEQTENRMRH